MNAWVQPTKAAARNIVTWKNFMAYFSMNNSADTDNGRSDSGPSDAISKFIFTRDDDVAAKLQQPGFPRSFVSRTGSIAVQ